MLPKQKGGYGIRPYKIINKKVGHIINVFSFVMCPIFFIYKEDFCNEKAKNVKVCKAHF